MLVAICFDAAKIRQNFALRCIFGRELFIYKQLFAKLLTMNGMRLLFLLFQRESERNQREGREQVGSKNIKRSGRKML